jgi:hypothetical protein
LAGLPASLSPLASLAPLGGSAVTPPCPFPTGPGADRADPCPHPGFDPDAPEETRLGLGDHDHFRIADRDTELVEGLLGRFFDGLARHLNPLHALSSLSRPF